MTQKQSQSDQQDRSSLLNQTPIDYAAKLSGVQIELFNRFQQMHKQWLDRVQVEVNLAQELASKLSSARSIPDAMTAYQDWGDRRFKMMAEDAKHVLDDTQKFMQDGAHLFSTGQQSKGAGFST
jgi:hypothetical protein